MIFEALAYPLGKLMGVGLQWFENREKRKEVELQEVVKGNDHKRELELMEKQATLQRELESIKTQGQVAIAHEGTSQEEMKQLATIALSDNEVKKSIIEHTPDWGQHAMTGVRIFLGIASGIVFFWVGIISTKLLIELVRIKFPETDPGILKTFIDSYDIFYHSTVSLVLMYVGVTHTNRRLGSGSK